MNRHRLDILAITMLLGVASASAEMQTTSSTVSADSETVVIAPLFDYPVPPEDLETLTERTNYLMDHFWDKLNVKNKNAVDQNALNHAFDTYAAAMQWADRAKVIASTEALLKRLDKNPVLLLQTARAAEEALYGPRAAIWIDEIYLRYAQAVVRSKKIDATRKLRFERQANALSRSAVGNAAPEFSFTRPDGREARYFPMSTPTMIYFGDPECFDCRMGKLKIDTDLEIADLVKQGRLNLLYIMDSPEEGWESKVADYDQKWSVGAAEDLDLIFDLRLTPSIYLIDSKGYITAKNMSVAECAAKIKEICNTD